MNNSFDLKTLQYSIMALAHASSNSAFESITDSEAARRAGVILIAEALDQPDDAKAWSNAGALWLGAVNAIIKGLDDNKLDLIEILLHPVARFSTRNLPGPNRDKLKHSVQASLDQLFKRLIQFQPTDAFQFELLVECLTEFLQTLAIPMSDELASFLAQLDPQTMTIRQACICCAVVTKFSGDRQYMRALNARTRGISNVLTHLNRLSQKDLYIANIINSAQDDQQIWLNLLATYVEL